MSNHRTTSVIVGALYIVVAICMLLLLHLGLDSVKVGSVLPSHTTLGFILLKAREVSTLSTIFVFSLGALMFYGALFQSRLLPRWLSVWGIVAIALHLATGMLMMLVYKRKLPCPTPL